MSNLPNIDDLVEPTHDEIARQGYVSVLRKRILIDYAKDIPLLGEGCIEIRPISYFEGPSKG